MARLSIDIINKLKEKDDEAISLFYNKYNELIYAISYSEIKNSFDADDLTSEIMTKIVNKINLYDPQKGDFDAWVITVSYNYIKDYFKKKNKDKDYIIANEDIVYSFGIFDDELKLYNSDLEKILTKDMYKIFICSYYYHMKSNDIAKILDISLSKYYHLYYKTRDIIKDYFKKK